MTVQSDPYLNERYARRAGGMPYGLPSSLSAPQTPYSPVSGGRSPMRQRLPILPDQSEHPNISPAGSGSSSGANPEAAAAGAEQQDQLRKQIQGNAANAAKAAQEQNEAAARDPNSAGSAASIAQYRRARDSSGGSDDAHVIALQRQQATDLGIDPSSSAHDIAAAASGPIHVGADGRMAGGDTGNESIDPHNPTAVRNAIIQIQAQKSGQQQAAVNQALLKGAGVSTPFSPASAPKFSTTAPMTLRDGTTPSATSPVPNAATSSANPPAAGAVLRAGAAPTPSPASATAPAPSTMTPPASPFHPAQAMGDPNDTAKYGPRIQAAQDQSKPTVNWNVQQPTQPGQPAPAQSPVAAPQAKTPFGPVVKPRKPLPGEPGYVGPTA